MKKVLFTSESVTEGHPDKICDQVSDAILDEILKVDPVARVACETLTTTGIVMVVGEITTSQYVDIQSIVRNVLKEIGYTRAKFGFDASTCSVVTSINEQSRDIALGVDSALEYKNGNEDKYNSVGAGDQGMMFGYATNETENYMPLALALAHSILRELSALRKSGEISYLRPDAKSQVTIEYSDDHKPIRIDSIVVSTQHDDFASDDEMLAKIRKDITEILIPRVKDQQKKAIQDLFTNEIKYHINPTGKFVIGGPHGDTGLTGRKIIVDTYGGKGAHGGGAFSGKDPSKVDRSAAYATRHIAKNLVAAGIADEVLVQVSYAIGVAEPCGLYINTYGTSKLNISDGEIAERVLKIFDLRPYAIEQNLKLRNPIYQETASYGHMGRESYIADKVFHKNNGEQIVVKDLEFFTWEKLDRVEDIKKEFGL